MRRERPDTVIAELKDQLRDGQADVAEETFGRVQVALEYIATDQKMSDNLKK